MTVSPPVSAFRFFWLICCIFAMIIVERAFSSSGDGIQDWKRMYRTYICTVIAKRRR
jgi:hypothetical protein